MCYLAIGSRKKMRGKGLEIQQLRMMPRWWTSFLCFIFRQVTSDFRGSGKIILLVTLRKQGKISSDPCQSFHLHFMAIHMLVIETMCTKEA